ncbi:cadherin repeat domain-containing protein, partial [Myxococcota bacterium]|nr:cadherin repeat domain-containing protein [Myxococcota bacterium]
MQIHTTSTLSSAHIPSRLLLLLFFSALLQVACDADTKSVGHCGDGFLDPSEQCDGTDFGGTTCGTLGHYNSVGHLACNADCTFNLTECGGFCGDGVLQLMYAEDCEGDDLNDATCRSEGYHGGTLSCGDDCRFITDLCTGMGNQRPTFTTTPGPSAQENTQYVYSAACSDPDGDDVTLSIGDSDTCYGEFTSAGGSGVYSFTPDESQGGTSCTLHLSCADAEITEHQMQVVNIQEVNQAPVIANLPASIDAAWALPTEFDVTAEDPDQPANSLFYEITASTCSFDATINAYGRIAFTCLAEDETCDLTIRAYDNGTPVMSDSEALHITCANRDPAFTTTPATVVEEHQEYVYDIACDDPDGHSVALTRGSDTCGGTFTPVSAGRATYTFTPDEARGGTTCEA